MLQKKTYRDIVYPPGWSMLPRVVALDFQTLVIKTFIKTDLQGFWSVRKFRLLAIWCITNGRKLNVTEMLTPLNLNEFFRFFWQLRGRISF